MAATEHSRAEAGRPRPEREHTHRCVAAEARPEPACPERYKFLAVHAYERGELSEKELANYLRCDIWEARRVIREASVSVEVDADGNSSPMRADFETSLLNGRA